MEQKIIENTDKGLIDTRDLFYAIWEDKLKVLILSGIIGIFSIVYSFSLTNEYTAVIFLTEVKNDKETSLSSASSDSPLSFSLPGRFGGGNGLSQELNTAVVMMKSWNFVDEFIRKNKLEVPLIAGEGWDPVSRELILDSAIYDQVKGAWKDNSFNVEAPSVRWGMYKEFLKELQITPDKNTGVHRISINSYSPDLSLKWTQMFYRLVNEKMREKKLFILNNNIANINEQIRLNASSSLRDRLYDIQSEQIKSRVIIEASPDYLFEPIGDPLVPFIKSYPRRSIIVMGLTFVGSILVVLGLILHRLIVTLRKVN